MFVRSVIGTLALFVAVGPLVVGTRRLRARLLPTWIGPPGWLAQFVVVISVCLLVVLGLGVVGWYSLVPTTLLLAACGIATWLVAERIPPRKGEPLVVRAERLGRPAKVMAVVAVSFVAATWGARTYVALSHGMVSIDSLWYHLPLAARYAHLHSITGIYHDVDNLSGFYPVNAELIHSLGMVLLGNDLLSMLLNVGWGLVALLAAWCIGRPHGMAAVCVTTVSVLLAAPSFVGTQPGAAHVDVVGVALLLSTAALLVTARSTRLTADWAVLTLAALPIGFAAGTKWTLLPISAAMTVGVMVLLPRGRRLGGVAIWLGSIAVLGSFSYLRNLVKAGSPLPPIELEIGPIGWARQVPEVEGMDSLASFLFDGDAWRDWLLPGLSRVFGYPWWAVLALVVVGLVLAVATGPGSLTRMLGVVGAAALVGYIVQPQLLTLLGAPYFFAANLRYAFTGMALGLVLLPLSPLLGRRWVALFVPLSSVVVIAVMQLDPTLWPTELRDLRWEQPVRGADAVAGVVIGVLALGLGLAWVWLGPEVRARAAERRLIAGPAGVVPSRVRLGRTAGIGVAMLALLAGTFGLDRWYLAHRYTRPEASTPFIPQHWRTWEWAREIHDERIGFRPPALSYPFYGNQLSNHVESFPGYESPRGGQLPENTPAKCERFLRLVNRRAYSYVVLFGSLAPLVDFDGNLPPFEQTTPELLWLDGDPNAVKVLEAPLEAVYRIDGPLDPSTCTTSAR